MQDNKMFNSNMVSKDGEFIAKSKRITEKNEAKGQNSLSKFFNGQAGSNAGVQGVKSNKAAFDHYAVQTAAYSDKYSNVNKAPEKPVGMPEV